MYQLVIIISELDNFYYIDCHYTAWTVLRGIVTDTVTTKRGTKSSIPSRGTRIPSLKQCYSYECPITIHIYAGGPSQININIMNNNNNTWQECITY